MTTLTWLHLSDLHACHPRTGWDAARIQKTLLADLEHLQQEHNLAPDLIFFIGDAAFGEIGTEPGKTLRGQLQVNLRATLNLLASSLRFGPMGGALVSSSS